MEEGVAKEKFAPVQPWRVRRSAMHIARAALRRSAEPDAALSVVAAFDAVKVLSTVAHGHPRQRHLLALVGWLGLDDENTPK
ncbi:MAG: hypothetical protein EXR77_13720 [Myxococcales bacterium]|nr:hypothetical protein [Myxococcales bacterium]